jgi:hypothetical protein
LIAEDTAKWAKAVKFRASATRWCAVSSFGGTAFKTGRPATSRSPASYSGLVEPRARHRARHDVLVRIHKTLRTTRAAAGVTKRLREIGDMVGVLEVWERTNDGR